MAIKELDFGYGERNRENEGRQPQEWKTSQRNRSWPWGLCLHIQCGSTHATAFSMLVPLPLEQPQSRVNMENSSRKI